MSQSVITNGNLDGLKTDKNDTQSSQHEQKSESATSSHPAKGNHEPNVRHIPIFVEGRDEPLYNRNIETSTVDSPISRPAPTINDIPQHGSLFNRCKDIPVKKVVPEFHAANFRRSESPARTIPINVIHTQTNKSQPQQSPQQQNKEPQQRDQRSQSPKPPSQPIDPITKIQNIQKEVLDLMEKVEQYKGGSRKDKNYVYLDEMLTQNLLKLDTIDTEGKENIKAARKEAINCINKCIQVLEAKADAAEKPESHTDQNKLQRDNHNEKMNDNSNESNNDKSN